jgi:hypothetical protein
MMNGVESVSGALGDFGKPKSEEIVREPLVREPLVRESSRRDSNEMASSSHS